MARAVIVKDFFLGARGFLGDRFAALLGSLGTTGSAFVS